jgi:hypothetical protein
MGATEAIGLHIIVLLARQWGHASGGCDLSVEFPSLVSRFGVALAFELSVKRAPRGLSARASDGVRGRTG